MTGDAWEASAGALVVDDLDIDSADVVFDRQDSGCLSYGIEARGRRWFVKMAQTEQGRCSLVSALRFHAAVHHRVVVAPLRWFESPGLTLVYPWVSGDVLNAATVAGSDRRGLERFRREPLDVVHDSITRVLDAHVDVAATGFVAVDFYDGCLLYDFDSATMRLIDLDNYRPGPFVVEADRLPGSRSYMAPEEFRRGAVIDERTNVFSLGRMIHHLLDAANGWRGRPAQADVVARATCPDPDGRYPSVVDLHRAWRATV